MIAVAHILRCYTFFFGTYGNGHSVLVAATYEDDVFLFQTKITDVDVGRNIYACQMAYMNTSVCVGQGGGDGCAFKLFLFHIFVLSDLLICFAKLQIFSQNMGLCLLFSSLIAGNVCRVCCNE